MPLQADVLCRCCRHCIHPFSYQAEDTCSIGNAVTRQVHATSRRVLTFHHRGSRASGLIPTFASLGSSVDQMLESQRPLVSICI
ncbi:cobalamin biosynthesis protein CbiG [Brucella melitensis]|uniref:Cobalamin biosynthesis protein CbiG n=2 Tax=Brucella TaxID=234 RepID=A0AAI8E954_BRUSS|nr:Cobalamin biosynthesis protein CbiG [Brucella canis HSK A52141]AIB24380.1 Hypothetical protein BSPT2_I0918 [Brucella suis bv. 2]AQQ57632.1 cobalamin biosynthesis protein CbiG [Brucella melitensis]ASU71953.1 cobalamin biosynthesis protein CbiG [Brucella abortus]ATN19779.1 cobalamin biosynthesis protein CbiG [Brucella canis]ATQ53105.1 cobalamin biosynthesis protein CbiG [Brucella suis]